MRKNKKALIMAAFLAVIILIGLVIFAVIASRKTEIYAVSYDGQVKFSAGDFRVDGFYVSARTGNSITQSENGQALLEKIIEGNPYLYDSFEAHYGEYSCTNYVFLYGGYYFFIWVDANGAVVIENAASEFFTPNSEFFFAFPKADISPIENEENYYSWQEIGMTDFRELSGYYQNLKGGYCIIDEGSKTIRLNCCDANNFREITTDYPITIIGDANGVFLHFDSEAIGS